MRTSVTFRTPLFENHEPKAHFINPNCFGEDLAAWLLERLKQSPLTFGAPVQEDYGWGFWGASDHWIAIILGDEFVGVENPQWLISVNYDPGLNLKKRLFGRQDRAVTRSICDAIHLALSSEPRIADIRWCDDVEMDCADTPA